MKNKRQAATLLFATSYFIASYTGVNVSAESEDVSPAVSVERKPNIIYILADNLGFGDVGFNGQMYVETPNIDRLAQDGMQFTQHYAGCTICAPSRCSLITGLHTGHCTVKANDDTPLNAEDVTVAELLQKNGYKTGIIGKWGLGNFGTTGFPNKKGFDYFFGFDDQTLAHSYYPATLYRNAEIVKLNNTATQKKDYTHDLFTNEALEFIKNNKDSPFYLYLAYTIPHSELVVPDLGEYANEKWPEKEKIFAAMVSRMDRDIGKLQEKLVECGIEKNTVVMFASDNGPQNTDGHDPAFFKSSGPFRGIMRDMYEGGIRVPFVVKWPGKIQAGSSSDHISGFWDFMPTACEIAGINPPEGIDGISYLPTLLGKGQQKKHEYMYWEFHEKGGKRAVRMDDWKAVRLNADKNPNSPLELYNLKTDIMEKNNIASKHPDIVAKMEQIMKSAVGKPTVKVSGSTTVNTPQTASNHNTIKVEIDGISHTFNPAPILVNDRTMVPMRAIFEIMGATVSWEEATETVTAVKGDTTVVLKIGSTEAKVNGATKVLDAPAMLYQDRTMVPLRFISEALGADVEWVEATNTVKITR
ncbi:MAG: Arylsulfatase precursor [Firmicutes bacterium ADurb.Bin193]|nr:MAG: Arylsulfatase precursor [Firmicutes bacterium ADurb.Bin193]